MSYTPYDPENRKFTDLMHEKSVDTAYSQFFGRDVQIVATSFEEDARKYVDYSVCMTAANVSRVSPEKPAILTVQEKWDRTGHDTVTIGYWHNNTDLPGEMYGSHAAFLVHGWAGKDNSIERVILVSLAELRYMLLRGDIHAREQINRQQGKLFLSIKVSDIKERGLLIDEYLPQNGDE